MGQAHARPAASGGRAGGEDTPVAAGPVPARPTDRPQRLFRTEGLRLVPDLGCARAAVFVDTRIELYPFEQWHDYIELGQGVHVEQLISKYAIDGPC
ncbi:MAG: hypothetical protein U0Z44_08920 [Kouleothrix sp.]